MAASLRHHLEIIVDLLDQNIDNIQKMFHEGDVDKMRGSIITAVDSLQNTLTQMEQLNIPLGGQAVEILEDFDGDASNFFYYWNMTRLTEYENYFKSDKKVVDLQ